MTTGQNKRFAGFIVSHVAVRAIHINLDGNNLKELLYAKYYTDAFDSDRIRI
jgi:hypothetical protein